MSFRSLLSPLLLVAALGVCGVMADSSNVPNDTTKFELAFLIIWSDNTNSTAHSTAQHNNGKQRAGNLRDKDERGDKGVELRDVG